jgi:toxin ParE1/3/4
MRPTLLWRPQAEQDLMEIYVGIGLENSSAAERLYEAIVDQAALLVRHPRLGVRRPEISPSARMLVEGVYLLLYEIHPDTDADAVNEVEIVRVIHGHRDIAVVF